MKADMIFNIYVIVINTKENIMKIVLALAN
jgi:hypothetical protein